MFLWAFTDQEMWFDPYYSHKPTRELTAQVRAILLKRQQDNPQRREIVRRWEKVPGTNGT